MLKNFVKKVYKSKNGDITYRIGGSGRPLLLLHGYPQTHLMWHKVAPLLSKEFTLILPDLRGYGESLAPKGDSNHYNYSKRVMAKDQIQLMRHLNFESFGVVGHDRGGRVAHRLARDNRESVLGLVILDICPTLDMYESTDKAFATAYFHWFFLIQPVGIPETLIEKDPKFWLNNCLNKWSTGYDFGNVKQEYEKYFSKKENIHGSCEDYRAGATIDLEHDAADRHEKLSIPICNLWGSKAFIGKGYDPIKIWKKYTSGVVSGKSLECGHFLPEEKPEETTAEIRKFFNSINYN